MTLSANIFHPSRLAAVAMTQNSLPPGILCVHLVPFEIATVIISLPCICQASGRTIVSVIVQARDQRRDFVFVYLNIVGAM